ncbi:hypothetical protein [Umezawaea sp.]|uniref:hypothetical protein n=1 Tax=Umezawaea sp. TaxID=1955258 RepID=UPI002ED0885E
MDEGEELLEVFGQVADVSLELAVALDEHGCDVARAAADGELLAAWTGARPDARSAVLLATAWGSRDRELEATDDQPGRHAAELHGLAREHTGDADGFRLAWAHRGGGGTSAVDADLRTFLREVKGDEALPLHGGAGALASRLGSEDGEPLTGLRTALVLLAPVRRAAASAG